MYLVGAYQRCPTRGDGMLLETEEERRNKTVQGRQLHGVLHR